MKHITPSSAFSVILFVTALLPFPVKGTDFQTIPKRTSLPKVATYEACSPYTNYGQLCVWKGGIEIPVVSKGASQFRTMVTLVMPPANSSWELYRSDFVFSLDYVYNGDCKSGIVTYKNDALFYKNDSVCNR